MRRISIICFTINKFVCLATLLKEIKCSSNRVSCDFKYVGPDGNPQKVNGLCILSQNIINEKIFLALWFWYVFLMVISALFFIYRLATILVPSVRISILCSKIGGSRRYVRQTVTRILRHSRPGDWFVLNQVLVASVGKFTQICQKMFGSLPSNLCQPSCVDGSKKLDDSTISN